MPTKQESITPQKLGYRGFWRFANSVLNKGTSAILSLVSGPEVLSSTSHKVKLFTKSFSKNSNLDDLDISLSVFASRTNLKLHNISVTSKMVQKVIINLYFLKAPVRDCIPVVVLENCESELSYILAELFSMGLTDASFPDCWKVSLLVPVFKNFWEKVYG